MEEVPVRSLEPTDTTDMVTNTPNKKVETRDAWVAWTQILANIIVPITLVFTMD